MPGSSGATFATTSARLAASALLCTAIRARSKPSGTGVPATSADSSAVWAMARFRRALPVVWVASSSDTVCLRGGHYGPYRGQFGAEFGREFGGRGEVVVPLQQYAGRADARAELGQHIQHRPRHGMRVAVVPHAVTLD